MLKTHASSAIVGVSDIARARDFYGSTLGLEVVEEGEEVVVYRTGDTSLVVYRSDEAGTNRANAVVWGVGDEIDAIVGTLAGQGVTFEHYPDMEREGDIHVDGPMKMAWFKDPSGNILHLNNM